MSEHIKAINEAVAMLLSPKRGYRFEQGGTNLQ